MRLALFALLGFMTVLFAAPPASAEPHRRQVDFEWEPIDGADRYELEITQAGPKGRTYKFKTKDAAWNGKLTPGPYMMKLRALDYRGVPGDWSPASPFDVALENARLTRPAPRAALKADDPKSAKVPFAWEPVGGATSYVIEIVKPDGEVIATESVKDTKAAFTLPVAQDYGWRVTALNDEGLKSEAPAAGEFTLLGTKLAKPLIEKPENEFVRELKWRAPENAGAYDVAVARQNPQTKKWEKIQDIKAQAADQVAFDPKWEGGLYRVDVRATGDRRVASDAQSAVFKVRKGDRSPAAEFTHEVRKSIDRVNGWYGIASYLVTMVQYASTDYDSDAAVSYNAVGGTGRLGAGYFKEDNPWGFLGIFDMSGFLTESGNNVTYSSIELSAVRRSSVGDRGELRTQLGLYTKEHSVVRGNPTTKEVSYDNGAVLGPHVGVEYWYSMTPKLGFQTNAHFYYSLMKQKTPNGGDVEPSLSNQFGFMGSYRFNRRFTGLVGYTRREDTLKYKSNSARFDGATNSTTLTGNYLNFFAEYAF